VTKWRRTPAAVFPVREALRYRMPSMTGWGTFLRPIPHGIRVLGAVVRAGMWNKSSEGEFYADQYSTQVLQ